MLESNWLVWDIKREINKLNTQDKEELLTWLDRLIKSGEKSIKKKEKNEIS